MGKEEKPRQRLASYLLRPDYPGTAENCQSKGREVGLDPQQPPAPGAKGCSAAPPQLQSKSEGD